MPFGLSRLVAPPSGPVSLALAKAHLRVTCTDEDDVIQAILDGATADAERHSAGLAFLRGTYALYPASFPRCDSIYMPIGPLQSVDSIAYLDAAGQAATVSLADVYVGLQTGRVRHKTAWPQTNKSPENVVVTFKAGWPTAADVPHDAKSAILLIVGERYENRGDGIDGVASPRAIPAAAERLLNNLRDATF